MTGSTHETTPGLLREVGQSLLLLGLTGSSIAVVFGALALLGAALTG